MFQVLKLFTLICFLLGICAWAKPLTLEEEFQKLRGEYLRINKLYLEERLKNIELTKKMSEANETKKEIEDEYKFCERDTSGLDKELDKTATKLDTKEEELEQVKEKYQELLKKCPASK